MHSAQLAEFFFAGEDVDPAIHSQLDPHIQMLQAKMGTVIGQAQPARGGQYRSRMMSPVLGPRGLHERTPTRRSLD